MSEKDVCTQDYRIVEEDGYYHLALVCYVNGQIDRHTTIVTISEEIEDAHAFCKRVYEASLKAPVFIDEEGYL